MKRWSLLQLAGLAPAAAAGLAVAGRAHAAPHAAPEADLSPLGQQLEGTWMLTVRLDGVPPPGVPPVIPAMNTFLPGGALFETGAGLATRSPGHGQWVRTGDREFAATFAFFRFDPAGRPLGAQRVTKVIRLDEGLDELRAEARFELTDPDGTVTTRGRATESGTRLRIAQLEETP